MYRKAGIPNSFVSHWQLSYYFAFIKEYSDVLVTFLTLQHVGNKEHTFVTVFRFLVISLIYISKFTI